MRYYGIEYETHYYTLVVHFMYFFTALAVQRHPVTKEFIQEAYFSDACFFTYIFIILF